VTRAPDDLAVHSEYHSSLLLLSSAGSGERVLHVMIFSLRQNIMTPSTYPHAGHRRSRMFYSIARFGHRPLAVSTIQEASRTFTQKMVFGVDAAISECVGRQVMLSRDVL